MRCTWEFAGESERPIGRGWKWWQCKRCQLKIRSPYGPEKIKGGICFAWPFWHEFGEWVAIALAAFGLSPQRYAWIRSKLGLDEVPDSGCQKCEARKAWLNTLGGRLFTAKSRWLKAIGGFVVRRVQS